MSKDAVFTMKLEPELRAAFMAAAASEDRPASQVVRELMRAYVEERSGMSDYDHYLRRKVEAGRNSMRRGTGRAHDDVEADFAAKREPISPDRS